MRRPLCLFCILWTAWVAVCVGTGGNQPSRFQPLKGQKVQVEGELAKLGKSSTSNILYLKNNSYTIQSGNYSYKYSIDQQILIYSKTPENYKIGNRLIAAGECAPPEMPGNPGQFDTAAYYKASGIAFAVNSAVVTVKDSSYDPVLQGMLKIRETFMTEFEQVLGKENASILSAMLLGEKRGLDPDVKKLYQQNGIAHILAISGLHISLIGMGLYRLLKKAGMPFFLCGGLSGVFLSAYGVLTGFGVSTKRAVMMFLIYLLAQMLGRTYDILSALSLSAVLILMQSPERIWDAGFLLSFLAVLGVAAVAPVLKRAGWEKNRLWDTLSVSLAVQYTTIPIILYFYFAVPLYGIFLNLLVIPLMSMVLIFGICGAAAGMLLLPAGVFIAAPCSYILILYKALCEKIMLLPKAVVTGGRPEGIQIFLYFLLLLILCVVKLKKRKFQMMKWGIGSILLICILFYRPSIKFSMTFLDVGQGDGICIQDSSGNCYFVDGGSSDVKGVMEYRISPFLKSKGIGKIDYYFVSHMDEDHMNGLEALLEEYRPGLLEENSAGITIRHLVLPKLKTKDDTYRRLEKLAGENSIPVLYFQQGSTLKDGDTTVQCLHPSKSCEEEETNTSSMVLLVTHGSFRALLSGDLEGEGEEHLMNVKLPGQIEVLKVAHHGSKNSTSAEFLRRIEPKYAVISCGEGNRYGHPHKELLKRLEEAGCRYELTPNAGAVTVTVEDENYWVEGYKEE